MGDGDKPARPDVKDPGQPEPPYKVFTTAHDEVVGAEELCDAEELTRLRAYLDQQLASLSNVVSRLANRLQRKLLAQQNRSWTFDLEEGMLDVARLTRVIIDPTAPLSFKQEEDTEFRDTVVTPPDRQFRLHARAADHGRGGLRRHPRPHAGALRRSRSRSSASPPAPGRAA